jgi:hypothetical protein
MPAAPSVHLNNSPLSEERLAGKATLLADWNDILVLEFPLAETVVLSVGSWNSPRSKDRQAEMVVLSVDCEYNITSEDR